MPDPMSRYPKRHDQLIGDMTRETVDDRDLYDPVFYERRHMLTFAASYAWYAKLALPEEVPAKDGKDIRFSTLTATTHAEILIDSIALAHQAQDGADGDVLDVLKDERLPERLRLFERYLAAGLDAIQERVDKALENKSGTAARGVPLDVVRTMVEEAKLRPAADASRAKTMISRLAQSSRVSDLREATGNPDILS